MKTIRINKISNNMLVYLPEIEPHRLGDNNCMGAPETVMLHENINDNHLNNLYCYGYYRSNIIDFQQFRYKD